MPDASAAPDLKYAIGLPPAEAIDYFKGLGYRISRNAVQAYNAAQAKAFTVTGITRMDLLQDVKAGLDKALAKGTTLSTFQSETNDLLRRRGWIRTPGGAHAEPGTGEVVAQLPPRRMQTIFRTNMQSALMAGKYQQLQDDVDIAPYWQYVAVMDSRTRPAHAAANGLIFKHDDPFWDSHFPPCGFNCRCSVRALRARDIDRRDLDVSDSDGMLEPTEVPVGRQTRPSVAFVDKVTRTRFVPDPGFGQRPVRTQQTLGQALGNKIEQVAPEVSAAVVAAKPRLTSALAEEYQGWARQTLTAGRPQHDYRVVGTLSPKIVKTLRAKEYTIANAALVLRDDELLHLARDAKRARSAALTRAQILQLPDLLAHPQTVLWDNEDPALVYVLDLQGQAATKAIVRVDWRTSLRDDQGRHKATVNAIRTAGVVQVGDLHAARYTPIEGSWKSED